MKTLKLMPWLFLLLSFNVSAHPGHDSGMALSLADIVLHDGFIIAAVWVAFLLLRRILKKSVSKQRTRQ